MGIIAEILANCRHLVGLESDLLVLMGIISEIFCEWAAY